MKSSETIPAKKTVAITISFKATPQNLGAGVNSGAGKSANAANQSKTGKLTITNQNTNISWVYYLKYVPI